MQYVENEVLSGTVIYNNLNEKIELIARQYICLHQKTKQNVKILDVTEFQVHIEKQFQILLSGIIYILNCL